MAGYAYGWPPSFLEWNWLFWATGVWQDHLDRGAARGPDLWDTAGVYRISPDALAFTVGGPLAQRPVKGAVFIVGGERLDLSATGADAPVFTFTPSATNYIWARFRQDGSRSAYPQVVVNTTGVSPGTGYVCVSEQTTNVTQITGATEPGSVTYNALTWSAISHKFKRGVQIDAVGDTNALYLTDGDSSMVPTLVIAHGNASYSHTLVSADQNSGGTAFSASATGPGGVGFGSYVTSQAAGFQVYCDGNGTAGAFIDTGSQSWALAITPSSLDPVHNGASVYGASMRIWASPSLTSNLTWMNSAGAQYFPWAALQAPTRYDSGALADATIVNGAANASVGVSAAQTFVQGCKYLIMLDVPVSTASAPNFNVTLTILVNGVADTYWNNRAFTPPNLTTADPRPWLHTTIYYTHTTATTAAATVLIRVNHSAGVGSITYRAPRIQIAGGMP